MARDTCPTIARNPVPALKRYRKQPAMKTRESGMPEEAMWQGFFDPPSILAKLGLDAKCGNVVDFGCGYGTFTIPAARIVQATVFAFDIEAEMVEATCCKAEAAELKNVVVMEKDFAAEGTGFLIVTPASIVVVFAGLFVGLASGRLVGFVNGPFVDVAASFRAVFLGVLFFAIVPSP
jgi:SAM-dependent methyltransferase